MIHLMLRIFISLWNHLKGKTHKINNYWANKAFKGHKISNSFLVNSKLLQTIARAWSFILMVLTNWATWAKREPTSFKGSKEFFNPKWELDTFFTSYRHLSCWSFWSYMLFFNCYFSNDVSQTKKPHYDWIHQGPKQLRYVEYIEPHYPFFL